MMSPFPVDWMLRPLGALPSAIPRAVQAHQIDAFRRAVFCQRDLILLNGTLGVEYLDKAGDASVSFTES